MTSIFASLSLKQNGVFTLSPYGDAEIVSGQYCKLAVIIFDSSSRPVTITDYSLKLRLKKADSTILVLDGTPFDNNKGETEFILSAVDSSLLKIGEDQGAEVEIYQTSSPTIKAFIAIEKAITVVDQVLKVV